MGNERRAASFRPHFDLAKHEAVGVSPVLPECSFSTTTGNAQTLKQEPRERGINTYERLRQFWTRFYSAHYMTLAVQSKGWCACLSETAQTRLCLTSLSILPSFLPSLLPSSRRSETLDTLEQWVREIFVHIPNK